MISPEIKNQFKFKAFQTRDSAGASYYQLPVKLARLQFDYYYVLGVVVVAYILGVDVIT